jgi:hypothetical protein
MGKGVQPVRGAATTNSHTQFALVSALMPRFQEIALAAFTAAVYFVAWGEGKAHIALLAL